MDFKNKKFFTRKLMEWYDQSDRPLPWKGIKDPYLIWLSEIILQQTRTEQGTPYYEKFKRAYPTVHDMAEAPEDEIMKLWQGLGYYSRARNMHHTAKHVSVVLEGKFPNTLKELQALKGIGPYTAAAITSFAFNLPHAVVDGNVYRVLARFFGIGIDIDDREAGRLFGNLAQELVLTDQPGKYNQAIMDFGATVCTPRAYKCSSCLLREHCLAFARGTIDSLPVKNKKIKKKVRYFNYFIVVGNDRILIRKRKEKDIWKNLYDFPLFESTHAIEETEMLKSGLAGHNLLHSVQESNTQLIHTGQQQLTHQKIIANFWKVTTEIPREYPDDFIWVDIENLSKFAFPRIITLFLEDIFLNLG